MSVNIGISEERLLEIISNYENSIGVLYERWDYATKNETRDIKKKYDYQAGEDIFDLLEEIKYLQSENERLKKLKSKW